MNDFIINSVDEYNYAFLWRKQRNDKELPKTTCKYIFLYISRYDKGIKLESI